MNETGPDWDHCRSFLAVFDTGSLSGAARALGLTQPTIARHVEQLETALGNTTLFARSPQGLSPTDAGLALEPHARSMAASAAALVRAASGPADAPAGVVRITASDVVGAEVLPEILRDIMRAHPALSFEVDLSNQNADLLRRDADIAVRMVAPKQDALVARPVGDVMLGLFGHRDYLAARGTPRTVDELTRHTIIGYDQHATNVRAMRQLGLNVRRDSFTYRTDNDLAQLNAIRAGVGLGLCHVALARRHGALVRVMPEIFAVPLPTWIVMHEDLRGVTRMRVVFDGLAAGLKAYAEGAR